MSEETIGGGMDTDLVRRGEIVQVNDVVMENGATWGMKTVIYERNGTRYCGCKTYDEKYYFGGSGNIPLSSNVDEAWKQAYKRNVGGEP